MALAVCLLFDPPGDRAVRKLWAKLEGEGIPTLLTHTHRRHQPHLSLAVLRTWDLERVGDALVPLATGGPVEVSVQGTVLFPRGRAARAAAVTAEVATGQQAVAEAVLATGADLHHHYAPGRWVPHISVATRCSGGQLAIAATAVNDVLPLVLRATRAALVDSGTGESWPLHGIA